MAEFPFRAAESAEPAQWLAQRMTTFGETVLSIVPSGFEAYARIFHPAQKVTNTSEDWESWPRTSLSWAEVATLTGRTAHKTMQWPSIRGDSPEINVYPPKTGESWVEAPDEGTLPLKLARTLWPLLEPHTQTPDRCFFAIWEGFGGLPLFVSEAPAFEIPARRFYLFEGVPQDIEQSFYAGSKFDDPGRTVDFGLTFQLSMKPMLWFKRKERKAEIAKAKAELAASLKDLPPPHQSANLIWPEDRSWCVATEIDFYTTYVAGPQTLIDDLLVCEGLEVYQLEPTDGISYASDTLNPEPLDPYASNFGLE